MFLKPWHKFKDNQIHKYPINTTEFMIKVQKIKKLSNINDNNNILC